MLRIREAECRGHEGEGSSGCVPGVESESARGLGEAGVVGHEEASWKIELGNEV